MCLAGPSWVIVCVGEVGARAGGWNVTVRLAQFLVFFLFSLAAGSKLRGQWKLKQMEMGEKVIFTALTTVLGKGTFLMLYK